MTFQEVDPSGKPHAHWLRAQALKPHTHGVDSCFLNLSELPFLHQLNADNNSVDVIFFSCLRADFVSTKHYSILSSKLILNFFSYKLKSLALFKT